MCRTRFGRCAALVLLGACGTDRVTQAPPAQQSHYVSTSGASDGDGTLSHPWDLGSGLAGAAGKVQPGDTIWLRGGTYRGGHRSTVSGAPGAPVVVRPYQGERAILDAGGATGDSVRGDFLIVGGDYTVLWGLELTDSDPNRATTTRPNMIVNDASHTKYINLVVHDGGIGFYSYPRRSDVEVNGCILYITDGRWGERVAGTRCTCGVMRGRSCCATTSCSISTGTASMPIRTLVAGCSTTSASTGMSASTTGSFPGIRAAPTSWWGGSRRRTASSASTT